MPIEFNCPHCDKILKTSEDKAGRQAKCPGCGEVILVPSTSGQLVEVAELENDEGHPTASGSPPAVNRMSDQPSNEESSDDTKVCPLCGETIKAAAIRCRFCRQSLHGSRPSGERLRDRREMRPFPPGEVISETWKLYSDRMGLLIGAFIIVVLLSLIPFGIASGAMTLGQEFLDQNNEAGAIGALSVAAVIFLVSTIFSNYLYSGYLTMQLRVARGQPAELGDLFSGGPYWGRMLLNSIVLSMIMVLGTLACFIPALFLAVMYFPVGYVLVDENLPGIQSLGRARQLTRGNWGSIFLVMIVACVAGMAGIFACGVGSIFAIPFANLMLAVAYDRMTCQTPEDSRGEVTQATA